MLKKRHLRRLTDADLLKGKPYRLQRAPSSPSTVASIFCTMSLSHWSSHCNFTYHDVDQVGDSVDERPDPLAVGLRVDGAGRRADGQTPRALLRVHLHKMKDPKQMLWAATLWEKGVPLFFDDEHAHPKKLKEVPHLRPCCADTV
jgi:hypothetical protein